MRYLRVKWKHSFSDEPVWLYTELDDNRCEVRKVEAYSDGRQDFASESESSGDTRLSLEPIPPLGEIASDPQFEPVEISAGEFERVWAEAHGGTKASNDL